MSSYEVERNAERVNFQHGQPPERRGPKPTQPPPDHDNGTPKLSPLEFPSPTFMVEIPSEGAFYPEGHPLYGQQTVELRDVTAADEDVLCNASYMEQGIAIDRFLQRLIVDSRVRLSEMLVGDKQALMMQARINAYGREYTADVTCPSCGTVSKKHSIDLGEITNYQTRVQDDNISYTERGTYLVSLPRSGWQVEIRAMTGADEARLAQALVRKRKNKKKSANTSTISDNLKLFIVAISGHTDRGVIEEAVDKMPAQDSLFLRQNYKDMFPNIDMSYEFTCGSCGHTRELEVPASAGLFWPGL